MTQKILTCALLLALVTAIPLAEAGKGGGSSFERDAAGVFRRVEEAVREVRADERDNRRAFLDLLARIVSKTPSDGPGEEGSGIIGVSH